MPTRDQWGAFIYLRDLRSNRSGRRAIQPTALEPDSYEAIFSEDRATIRRSDHSLTTVMEVLVSPEDDSEVRRISITNNGTRLREIEVTSYAELALARPAMTTRIRPFPSCLWKPNICARPAPCWRPAGPRSPSDKPIWAAHLSVVDGGSVGDVQYETDRGKFLTRERNARSASAVFEGWPLSNSDGAVLDPIFSLRRRVQIPRGQTVTIGLLDHGGGFARRDSGSGRPPPRRGRVRAGDHSGSDQRPDAAQYLGIGGDDAHLFQLLANYLIYHDDGLRAPPEVLERGGRPASALWGAGVSGDLPIALVRISEEEEPPFVTQMLHAHEYLAAEATGR